MGFSAGDNRVTELVSRNPDIRRLFSADELRTLSYEEIKSLYNERVSSGSETTRNSRMSDLRSAIPAAQVPNAAPALVQPAPGPTPANNLASMGIKGPARPGVALPDPVAPKVRPTVPGNPTDLRNQQSPRELVNARITQLMSRLNSRVGSTFAANMFTSDELTSMSDAQFNAEIDNRLPNAERFSFVPATELFTANELWTLSHADYKAQFTVRSNARLPLNPPPIGNPNNNGFDPRGGSDCNTNGIDDSIDLTPVTAADNCVDAQFVCAGSVYSGTTVGANTSTSNCTGTAAPDVWYKYMPSADGTLTLSFCTGGGSVSYDSSLGIFADCTTTVPLACNDDFCGLSSQVSLGVTAGTTYFLRVSGFSSNSGTYNLAVIGPPSSCGGGSSDCDSNGTPDECDLAADPSRDCNSNGTLDQCEPGFSDCNSNGTTDLCEPGFGDCNTNGTADFCDPSSDCNSNGIPDECELTGGDSPIIQLPDAVNGYFSDPSCSFCGTGQQAIADNFSLSSGATISGVIVHGGYFTGNVPYTPDVFSVVIHDDSAGLPGTTLQTDSAAGSRVATGVTLFGVSEYRYVIPITSITLGAGTYWVEVTNGGAGADTWFWETGGAGMGTITNSAFATTVPGSGWFVNGGELSLELVTGAPTDCDGNGSLDECEIADGRSDCNSNGTLDACEPGGEGDCNSNGTVDACDTVVDCNTNDILDECDIAGGSNDCDSNGIPDECELVDCNTNGTLDSCDLAAGGGGNDCDTNGTLDECDEDDCNNNDIPDACDLAGGGEDCNTNGSIDSCEASGGESPINQPPNAVNGFFSDGSCSFCGSGQQAIADNFSLSSNTTISGVIVHGGYFTGNSPYNPDSFNVIIHSDGGGIPGGTLQTDTGIAGTRATTGVTLFGVSEYRYEIPFSPINLGAGTYWVEVTNEGAGADTWFWETGAAGMGTITNSAFATTVPGSGWFTNGGELSLEIITGLPTDCDGNGSLDVCELANGATDCNSNGILDRCEPGGEGDCNSNGTVDACDVVVDCNTNDVLDECDIAGDSDDCNLNGVPDECEFIDCNTNGTLDSCDVAGGGNDCNTNSIPDECETGAGGDATDTCENAPSICPGATYSGSTAGMAPTSGLPGVCGASDASPDVYYKYTPTADGSLTLSFCPADGGSVGYDSVLHVLTGCPATSSVGCNDDSCGLSSRLVVSVTAGTTYYVRVSGFAGSSGSYTLAVIGPDCFAPSDCNTNGTLDVCEIAADPSIDCDTDGVIDLCQPGGGDCNANGTTDRCEAGFADCNTDNTADFCQLDGNDCNTNGVPDECDPDCNTNAIPDECDILSGASQDCNTNSTPDECETSGGASPVSQPPNAVNGFFSDPTCSFCGTGQQAIADNFSLSQSTSISGVIVHGGYFTGNSPYSPDDFSIVIHSDGGGVPGATIQTDSGVVGTRVATGVVLFGVDEYRYVLPITPILLAPGTYWVEVTNGGAGADTWFWETGAAGAGTITNSAFATTVPGSGWFANGGELSLDIVTGSPTDCNTNGSLDVCEIANGGSDCNTNNILDNCEPGGVGDCNSNGTPDACETVVIDCNTNLQLDECDISSGASQDCDSNGTPDECELIDCNTNGTLDSCDTLGGTGDCNTNGVPDECEGGCNTNGIPDECDILSGDSDDCNSNGTPDECEISGGGDATDSCANAPTICTGAVYSGSTVGMAPTAGLPGVCGASDGSPDVYYSYTAAADGSLTLSMCPADGGSTTYDTVLHVLTGCPATASVGCNDDSCGLSSRLVVGVTAGTTYSIRVSGFAGSSGSYSMAVLGPPCVVPNDCNTNGSIDTCEINDNPSIDCDSNGVIDDCEGGGADCNSNGTRDRCDPGYADCNNDGIADFCQLDANDCNANGTPDDCEADCNTNSIPDDCDIDSGASIDCNTNGVPDECDAAPVSGLSQPADAVNGYFSDPTCSFCGTGAQAIADNFSVGGPGSLEGVTFTGGYYSGNAPYNPDDFTVIIHSDSAGLPGAAVDTQMNVPGTRVDTGVILFGVNRYEYTLTLNPVSLAAGTYWIEITNGGAGADTWFWETGAISGGTIPNSAFATTVPGSGWFANGGEMSMTLLLGNPNDANGNGIPDECEAVCTCQGDTNGDNLLDGADVQGFTDCLISGTGCDCTDSDHDGTPANGDAADDLAAFVADLLSGATCPNP